MIIEEIVLNKQSGYKEDSGYQKMFKKELDKAAKVFSMSLEKKHFLIRLIKNIVQKMRV